MPRRADPRLLELFAESGRNVHRTAELLRDLLNDYPESNGIGAAIVECEHEGDRIAHDILHRAQQHTSRRAVPEPADVHALTGALDVVAALLEQRQDLDVVAGPAHQRHPSDPNP